MLIPDILIAAASEQTGLVNFGAQSWNEGFERIVAAFNEGASLNSFGEQQVGSLIITNLVNRLEIEDWHRREPEIVEQAILRPVFGVGLPRTGSTALGVMLGQDPSRRTLRTWEARRPCPPPETATQLTDPRIDAAQLSLDRMLAADGSLAAMIPMSAEAATECLILMSMDFHSKEFEAFGSIDSYNQWLLDCDMVPTYRFHKRVLQLLQWRCPPNRWFLRTPVHSPFLPALDEVYPDARFVMTHRDVTKAIPSNIVFVLALSHTFSDRRDLQAMARHMVNFWEIALRRLFAFRDAGNEHRFFDIKFADFQSNPLQEIRRLYDWLEEPLSNAAETNMRSWWEAQPEDRQATAKIALADLGITVDELRQRFAFYTERFGQ